jgi:Arc/MetJ-type ribon-helix-helix transcriptional regulator
MSNAHSDSSLRQLNVRLPRELYARAQRAAKARRTSVSELVRQLLQELDFKEREREVEQAYELLGQDKESAVEGFFEAQAEVARRG